MLGVASFLARLCTQRRRCRRDDDAREGAQKRTRRERSEFDHVLRQPNIARTVCSFSPNLATMFLRGEVAPLPAGVPRDALVLNGKTVSSLCVARRDAAAHQGKAEALLKRSGGAATLLLSRALEGGDLLLAWAVASTSGVRVRDVDAYDILKPACREGRRSVVEIVMAVYRLRPIPAGEMLGIASGKGHAEVVAALLAGAVPNRESMETSLILAARGGHVGVVRVLLGAGVDVNSKSGEALCSAIHDGNAAEVVRAFMEAGADVRACKSRALLAAAIHGDAEVAEMLLRGGADPNARGGEHLLVAVYFGHSKTVEVLLAAGADVRAADGEALCTVRRADTASILLKAGADPNAKNGEPLKRAVRALNAELVEVLLAAGADPRGVVVGPVPNGRLCFPRAVDRIQRALNDALRSF